MEAPFAALIGFFVGSFLLSALMRWAIVMHTSIREYRVGRDYPHLGRAPNIALVLVPALLHSGPWILVGAAFAIYTVFAHGYGWRYWFLGGVLFYAALSGAMVLRFFRARNAARAK